MGLLVTCSTASAWALGAYLASLLVAWVGLD
jgi:hypothetical protein